MIKLVQKCSYCGEEYWDAHVCKEMMADTITEADLNRMFPSEKNKDTWDYVIEDIKKRNHMGYKKYGVTLKPSTDEDMLQHAYEEALDLTVYLKTEILKRKLKGA